MTLENQSAAVTDLFDRVEEVASQAPESSATALVPVTGEIAADENFALTGAPAEEDVQLWAKIVTAAEPRSEFGKVSIHDVDRSDNILVCSEETVRRAMVAVSTAARPLTISVFRRAPGEGGRPFVLFQEDGMLEAAERLGLQEVDALIYERGHPVLHIWEVQRISAERTPTPVEEALLAADLKRNLELMQIEVPQVAEHNWAKLGWPRRLAIMLGISPDTVDRRLKRAALIPRALLERIRGNKRLDIGTRLNELAELTPDMQWAEVERLESRGKEPRIKLSKEERLNNTYDTVMKRLFALPDDLQKRALAQLSEALRKSKKKPAASPPSVEPEAETTIEAA